MGNEIFNSKLGDKNYLDPRFFADIGLRILAIFIKSFIRKGVDAVVFKTQTKIWNNSIF